MKRFTPFLICLFVALNLFAQKQDGVSDSVSNIFRTFIHNNNKKNIFLQTDRKLYIAGENIWFKAWVLKTASNKVDLSDKHLFTDLVDDKDSVIAKLVLNNREFNTSGAFTLPDTLKTGFYWIRCYTAQLLKEDSASIFIQPVYVLNKRLKDENDYNKKFTSLANKDKSNSVVIHFYPERLTGIPTVISTGVLQITDANNNPLTTQGTLINDKDSTITSFTTNHFGLTRITFLADNTQKYTAVFRFNGRDIKYQLPSIDHYAMQLSVANQTAKNIKAFVTLEDSIAANSRTIILGMHGDSLCYAAVGTGTYGINIPLNNFPGGIASLLLFNEQQQLIMERKIFIDKDNYQLEVKANKRKYAARENATISLKAEDDNREPLETDLNISVQDAWLTQLSDSIEINNLPPTNPLLLSNWLALYHEKYSSADIDLLMMTTKSLSNYNNDLATTVMQSGYEDDERLVNFMGKITDKKNIPVKERVITVMAKNQSGFFSDIDTTKDDGSFKIPLPQNMDSLSLSVQVMDKHKVLRTDDNIIIDNFSFPQFVTPVALKQQFFATNINTLTLIRKYHVDTAITFQGKGWLTPVIVNTIQKKDANYDESKRISSISQILTYDKFKNSYQSMGYALLTVPGVTISFGDISIFGPGVIGFMSGKMGRPLLIVDGVDEGFASMEYLNSLNPSEIDFIEVLRGGEAGIYGMRAANGVISVNTRRGPRIGEQLKNNFRNFTPFTYHVNPQFPMPDYSIPEIKTSKSPDPRTTIYWNGNVFTDSSGHASVNFYTADNPSNYTVTVTGLSAKGDIIYKRILINRN